ncbi:Type 1 glutamine amidotransferase-like domain-containing protein [Candidatus Uhrbacteria bacterium]|nr:Type 1 glutamine amidotransferase-like domain-containing protein [Candidatus Uhrbacteria bacterium]
MNRPRLILTSSFSAVARELSDVGALPKKSQRVAFIPTAGDVYKDTPWIEADRKALVDLGYSLFDVDLKKQDPSTLKQELESADIIFVAGGNTTYLFEYAHTSGFISMIPDLLNQNRIYIGSSAGSLLAGPSVEPFLSEDIPELPNDFYLHNSHGLNIVDYIVLPHYPDYAVQNDEVEKEFSHRFTFVKLKDTEYRIEK